MMIDQRLCELVAEVRELRLEVGAAADNIGDTVLTLVSAIEHAFAFVGPRADVARLRREQKQKTPGSNPLTDRAPVDVGDIQQPGGPSASVASRNMPKPVRLADECRCECPACEFAGQHHADASGGPCQIDPSEEPRSNEARRENPLGLGGRALARAFERGARVVVEAEVSEIYSEGEAARIRLPSFGEVTLPTSTLERVPAPPGAQRLRSIVGVPIAVPIEPYDDERHKASCECMACDAYEKGYAAGWKSGTS